MRSGMRWAVWAAVLAGGCHGAGGATGTAATTEAPAVAVTSAPVERRAVRRVVPVVGTLFGQDEVLVSPKQEGVISRILFDAGDVVRPGDLLLEQDPTDARNAVAEAESALRIELVRLGLSELPDGRFNPDAVPSVTQARLKSEFAGKKLERARANFQRKAMSSEEYELTETDHRVAQSALDEARLLAEATLASARFRSAGLRIARQKLADCRLVAPTPPLTAREDAGLVAAAALQGPRGLVLTAAVLTRMTSAEYVVAQRMTAVGETFRAQPDKYALRLVLRRPLRYKATLPERHAGELHVGQAIEMSVEAHPGRKFVGTLTRINPTVDPVNRTFGAEAGYANAAGELMPGMFARGEILTRLDPAARVVPAEALYSYAGVSKVFVLEGGAARAVEVRVGVRGRDWAEVVGDLPDPARVATSGLSALVDGSKVRER